MVWLSGWLPYERVEEVFTRLGPCRVPRTTVWDQVEREGEQLKAHQERRQAQVSVERVKLAPPGRDHRQRKSVSIDGGMVHIRGEGWKEMKVGAIGDVVEKCEQEGQEAEAEAGVKVVDVGYAAVLGSPEAFGPALWALAVEKEVPQAAETSVTADGAPWIWNVAADLFPDGVQIVDWYHACEHLAGAAHALHPEDAERARRWYERRRDNLWLGELRPITTPLEEAGLSDQAQYFHTHQRRMRYQEFREDGYPIGSGTVESGIKQFKARLSGPGMRWSRAGAERMLVIRGAVLAGTFDDLWAAAA